jgi:hypothetical protein
MRLSTKGQLLYRDHMSDSAGQRGQLEIEKGGLVLCRFHKKQGLLRRASGKT